MEDSFVQLCVFILFISNILLVIDSVLQKQKTFSEVQDVKL